MKKTVDNCKSEAYNVGTHNVPAQNSSCNPPEIQWDTPDRYPSGFHYRATLCQYCISNCANIVSNYANVVSNYAIMRKN